jgi:hypothetical protein
VLSRWLVLVQCDEFLHCTGRGKDGKGKQRRKRYFPNPVSIDIGKAVLKCIQSCNDYDNVN